MPQRTVSVDVAEQMAQLYREGESLDAIGQRFNFSRPAVRRAVVRGGLAIRPSCTKPHKLSDKEKAEAIEASRGGESGVSIARRLGVSTSNIQRILQQSRQGDATHRT
jgi:transposase